MVMFLLVACDSRDDPSASVAAALHSAASRGEGAVNFARMTDFDWDEVAFLAPYTSRAAAESVTGTSWDGYEALGLDRSDSFSLIVFINNGSRVRVVKVTRCRPDIVAPLSGQRYSRAETFRIERDGQCSILKRG